MSGDTVRGIGVGTVVVETLEQPSLAVGYYRVRVDWKTTRTIDPESDVPIVTATSLPVGMGVVLVRLIPLEGSGQGLGLEVGLVNVLGEKRPPIRGAVVVELYELVEATPVEAPAVCPTCGGRGELDVELAGIKLNGTVCPVCDGKKVKP